MSLEHLKDNEIESTLSSTDVPVLLDFTASWCGPCKALTPLLEKISADFQGKLKIFKVDIDEAPEATTRYGIRGVPTLIAFKDARRLGQTVGVVSREKILDLVELK